MPSVPFADAAKPVWKWLKRASVVQRKEARMTIGLDIGSSAVKVVALGGRKAGGARPLLGQRAVPIADSSESKVSEALHEAFDALKLPSKAVNLSVSGQWVIMRVVEMTAMSAPELAQALPFEAQRYLPFNVQEVVLDGATLGPTQDGNKAWVLIVACKRDLLERRIDWIRQAGLEPAMMDVDALALANAFTDQAGNAKLAGTHALIHVGAQWTNLVVLKKGVPYLVRDIPWGGEKLARHVAEQVGMEEAVVSAQLKAGGTLEPNVLDAMKVTCEGLVSDLQLSFDFFESRHGPPPEQLLVSGGVSQAAGFLDALKAHVSQPVVPWTPGQGLSGQFTVAYGLALRSGS